jgi:hypothetical protein
LHLSSGVNGKEVSNGSQEEGREEAGQEEGSEEEEVVSS